MTRSTGAPLRAVLAMHPQWRLPLFGPGDAILRGLIKPDPPLWFSHQVPAVDVLARTEVLITGWGSPFIGESELARMPRLSAVLHAAGSVRAHLSSAVWEHDIRVTSAAAANARPVAEYTLAMILLANKRAFAAADAYRSGTAVDPARWTWTGNLGRRIGIVGASQTGRAVLRLLRPFDFEILVFDPTADPAAISALGARSVPIAELFASSDVISLHAPLLPATAGLVTRDLLEAMRPGSILINTARGALIDESALIDVLTGGRIEAILDVTVDEPLRPDSPLRALPNVRLTPHIAGAQGSEVRGLGMAVVEELARLIVGTPALGAVYRDTLDSIA